MNWKVIFLFLHFSFIDSQNEAALQQFMMTFIGDNSCNNVDSYDINFKYCQINIRINSYSTSFCSYLQWKSKDSLEDEKID